MVDKLPLFYGINLKKRLREYDEGAISVKPRIFLGENFKLSIG